MTKIAPPIYPPPNYIFKIDLPCEFLDLNSNHCTIKQPEYYTQIFLTSLTIPLMTNINQNDPQTAHIMRFAHTLEIHSSFPSNPSFNKPTSTRTQLTEKFFAKTIRVEATWYSLYYDIIQNGFSLINSFTPTSIQANITNYDSRLFVYDSDSANKEYFEIFKRNELHTATPPNNMNFIVNALNTRTNITYDQYNIITKQLLQQINTQINNLFPTFLFLLSPFIKITPPYKIITPQSTTTTNTNSNPTQYPKILTPKILTLK